MTIQSKYKIPKIITVDVDTREKYPISFSSRMSGKYFSMKSIYLSGRLIALIPYLIDLNHPFGFLYI